MQAHYLQGLFGIKQKGGLKMVTLWYGFYAFTPAGEGYEVDGPDGTFYAGTIEEAKRIIDEAEKNNETEEK